MTTLVDEILFGSPNSVAKSIQAGADVNDYDVYGYTPLIEAAVVNSIEKTEILLNAGAQVNKRDMAGRSALHWAADNDNVELCELLLRHKADPNAYSKSLAPVLVNPLLRNNKQDLKNLLYSHGAVLKFAKDYINTKLLGHRFSLTGKVHMVDHQSDFRLVDLEGFYLEF